MYDLTDFKNEFDDLILKKLSTERKNILLANIMTKMEHHFKIPALNDNEFNAKNKKVITLYRQISDARKF